MKKKPFPGFSYYCLSGFGFLKDHVEVSLIKSGAAGFSSIHVPTLAFRGPLQGGHKLGQDSISLKPQGDGLGSQTCALPRSYSGEKSLCLKSFDV